MRLREAKYLLPLTVLLGILLYIPLLHVPSYTRWATILLILPSVFFLLQKNSKLEYKKLLIVCAGAAAAGLLWDHLAIQFQIWNFPHQSVVVWFLGIPLEEYVFGICFSIIVLGIYTSLPAFKTRLPDGPRIKEVPLLIMVFVGQLLILLEIFYSNPQSYFKWLLILATIPSLFYLWRKGEKIDEVRLCITLALAVIFFVVVDLFFIGSSSWFYYQAALLGKIGIVPFDDTLFIIFTAITVIGFYTSLPKTRLFTGKW